MAQADVPSAGGIVLPAHTVTVFDPRRIFTERVGERRVVYLDNNIWIDLRDTATEPARRCYQTCLRAVADQRAVFPVSYAAVSELLEIESAELRGKQADVMDSLCRGLTFRTADRIHGLEAEDVFRHLFLDAPPNDRRRETLTMVTDYTGDGKLHFQEGLHAADVEAFVRDWRAENPALQVRWIVEHLEHAQTRRNHARVEAYGAQIDAVRAAHREHLGVERVDREILAHEERASLYKSLVVPAIQRVDLSRQDLARIEVRSRELGANSRRMLRQSFRTSAPSMETIVQIFSTQARNVKRVTERQDFWDAEHASVAFAYADAFVTADRGLKAVLGLGQHQPPTARAVVLSSVERLTAWLHEIP